MAVTLFKRFKAWLDTRRFWCNLIAGIVAISLFTPLTYWTIDREPPFVLSDGKTIPSVVTRGQNFQMSWYLKSNKPVCPGFVSVRIVDSEEKVTWIAAQESYIANHTKPMTSGTVIGRERTMPGSVAPGKAIIYVDNIFECNPIQDFFWPLRVAHPPVTTQIVAE